MSEEKKVEKSVSKKQAAVISAVSLVVGSFIQLPHDVIVQVISAIVDLF